MQGARPDVVRMALGDDSRDVSNTAQHGTLHCGAAHLPRLTDREQIGHAGPVRNNTTQYRQELDGHAIRPYRAIVDPWTPTACNTIIARQRRSSTF